MDPTLVAGQRTDGTSGQIHATEEDGGAHALDVAVYQNGPAPASTHGGVVALTDVAAPIIAANPKRVFLEIQNDGGDDFVLQATDATPSIRLYPTASRVYRFEEGAALAFGGKCDAGKTTTARYLETLRA